MSAALSVAWHDVGAIEDIPRLGARIVALLGRRIALFRTRDDRVFALEDRCPHRGGPLSQGIVHGQRVTCPLHGWTVDLESGEAVAPDRGCAPRIPVALEGGRILLNLAGKAG